MNKIFMLTSGGGSFWKNLAEWYQNSVIHEVLTYLEEKYFSVEFGQYQNFSIGASTGNTLRNIVLGLALGLILACAITAHTKQGVGRFVRTLIRNDCTSPETAKTLSELGYFQNPSIRRELKRRVTLGKLVRCVEEDAFYEDRSNQETVKQKRSFRDYLKSGKSDFRIDFTTAHFFVPEELRYRAEVRFERKGASWIHFAIIAAATLIISALLCFLMPDLVRLADNLITLLSP